MINALRAWLRPLTHGYLGFGGMLEAEEYVEAVYRKRLTFTLSRILLSACVFFVLAGLLYYFYPYNCGEGLSARFSLYSDAVQCPIYSQQVRQGLLLVTLFLLALGGVKILRHLLWWWFNALLLTNANLMIVEWQSFLNRRAVRIDYWNLDEIAVEKRGWRAFVYGYGTLHFLKAAGGDIHIFDKLPHPDRVAKRIEAYCERMVHQKNLQEDTGIKSLLTNLIGRHVTGTETAQELPLQPTAPVHSPPPVAEDLDALRARLAALEAERHALEETPIPTTRPLRDRVIEKRFDDEGGIRIQL
ncbi:hypothetical protein H6771_01445 [Candidatus Peribacteria bacterium]|nr:hypothetical protein [Candidatus Peribacteria bacterium]